MNASIALGLLSSSLIIFGGLLFMADKVSKAIKGLPGWKEYKISDEQPVSQTTDHHLSIYQDRQEEK